MKIYIHFRKPNPNAQAMVSHGRVELLAHPLSQKYLQMKWNSYGKYYHVANLLIYSVFLLFVTLFSSELMTNVSNLPSSQILNQTIEPISEVCKILTTITELYQLLK